MRIIGPTETKALEAKTQIPKFPKLKLKLKLSFP